VRIYELVVGLALLLALVGFFRFQYNRVVTEATSGDRPPYQVIPAATPVYQQICRDGTSNCLIPTITPLFSDSKPSRGLSVP
jgi:hypothetical protein